LGGEAAERPNKGKWGNGKSKGAAHGKKLGGQEKSDWGRRGGAGRGGKELLKG
jgi:hypothetical protein